MGSRLINTLTPIAVSIRLSRSILLAVIFLVVVYPSVSESGFVVKDDFFTDSTKHNLTPIPTALSFRGPELTSTAQQILHTWTNTGNAASASCVPETNLIPNCSFEDPIPSLTDWQIEKPGEGLFPILFWSSGIYHGPGRHSAGIINFSSNEKSSWTSTIVPIAQHEQLQLSGWIYAAFLSGRAYINLAFFDNNQIHISGHDLSTSFVTRSSSWTQLSSMVIAPEGAAFIRVECSLIGIGVVWFDEIALTNVAERTPILHLSQNDEPDPVGAGETLIYDITYSNTGQVPATNICITDTFDASVTPIASSHDIARAGSHWWAWDIGPLAPNSRGNITITLLVNSPLTGGLVLANRIALSSREVPAITDEELTEVIAVPTLNIVKVGQPDPVEPGGTLVYTISYSNTGTAQATDVLVEDVFDSNVVFKKEMCTPPPDLDGKSLGVWNIGKLEAGEQGTIICPVVITNTAPSYSVLQNVAAILSREKSEVSTYVATRVVGSPLHKLIIEPPWQTGSGLPGSSTVYTLSVRNYGSTTDEARLEAISPNHWPIITHVIKLNLSPLESTSAFVTTTIPDAAESGFYDPMIVTAYSSNPMGNASATITTTVRQKACLSITASPGVTITPYQAIGTAVAFTHTITNCGNGTDTVTVTVDSTAPSWLKPSTFSFTATLTWPDTPIVVTATVLAAPAQGESPAYLTVRAVSWANSSENSFTVDRVDVRRYPVYLPLMLKNYPRFCNGNFEIGDLRCWIKYNENADFPVGIVNPSTDSDYNCFDTYAARIGKSGSVPDNEVPIGRFGIAQAVVVSDIPNPKLQFDYCMYSYDIMEGPRSHKIFDIFAVTINDPITYTWRTGNPGPNLKNPWASSPSHIPIHQAIDLSIYRGKTVSIYFLVWNQVTPIWNTWVYIDNIDGDFEYK
jgi:uncharacterized repeat protein (TIGR01451 family)